MSLVIDTDLDRTLAEADTVVPKVRVELTRGCPHRFLRDRRVYHSATSAR